MRAIFEYEFHCGTNASETTRKINSVFGESSTSYSTVSFWFVKFRSGDFSGEDSALKMNHVEDRYDTRKLASNVGVSAPTILDHLR